MIYAAKIDQTAPDCFEVSFPDKPNAFTFGVSLTVSEILCKLMLLVL
jgi:hypothetical protein